MNTCPSWRCLAITWGAAAIGLSPVEGVADDAGSSGDSPYEVVETTLAWKELDVGFPAPLGSEETFGVRTSGPTGALTLEEAVRWAEARDPGLAALRLEVAAVEAEASGVDVRPNPELGIELENFAGSGGASGLGGADATVSLSQAFELGGKRSKRKSLGDHESNLARWEYTLARNDRAAETKVAFVAVMAAQEQLQLAEDLVLVAEEMLASISRRVKAGSSSPIEESRARVELEITKVDLEEARRELASARTRLASNWNGATFDLSFDAVGSLDVYEETPTLDELLARLDTSPAFVRWDAESERRRAGLALERAMARPDLTIGSGVRYSADGDDVSLLVGVGLPLSVFDRNRGASVAAERRIERVAAERAMERNQAATELAQLHHDLIANQNEARAIRVRALPEAETAFAAARDAYLRGAMRLTDVLDIERLLFELRSRYVAVAAAYHTSYAEIQRRLGTPVNGNLESSGGRGPAQDGMGGSR